MDNKRFAGILGGLALVALMVYAVTFFMGRDSDQEVVVPEVPLVTDAETPTEEDVVYDYDPEGVITITADMDSDVGIERDATFTLKHLVDMDASEVKEGLVIEPEVAFDVEDAGNMTYRIRPLQELPDEKTLKVQYRFDNKLYGNAFNVKESFKVKNEYPADGRDWVNVNTGIELTFTRPVTDEMMTWVSIAPEVEGSFSADGYRMLFVPDEDLAFGTTYEVAIDEPYSLKGEEIEPMSFTFTTRSNYDTYFYFKHKTIHAVGTEGPQVLAFYSDSKGGTMTVDAYKIEGDPNELLGIKGHGSILKSLEDKSMGSLETTMEARYESTDWRNSYLILDEVLQRGVYYLVAKSGDSEAGAFVQVTDRNAYVMVDSDELIFWAAEAGVDDMTGELWYGQELLGVTDAQGFANIKFTPEEDSLALFTFRSGNEISYLPTELNRAYDTIAYDYYSYIYTDRSVYKSTDTIHVSGYAMNRENAQPDTVTVALVYMGREMETKEVALTAIGTYETFFDIKDYKNSYVDVELRVGDDLLDYTWLSIYDFEKPTYTLTTGIDKAYIQQGDEINYFASVGYFDGTPLTNAKVGIDYSDYDGQFRDDSGYSLSYENKTLETGTLNQTLRVYSDSEGWRPEVMSISAEPLDLQNFYAYAYDTVYVFPKDTMIEIQDEGLDDGSLEIKAQVHKVNISGITDDVHDEDAYRGQAVPGQVMNLKIEEIYYDKIFVEQRYSAIFKETYDVFDYVRRENVVLNTDFVTDGEGLAEYIFDGVVEDRYYIITVSATDGRGSKVTENAWYGALPDTWNDWDGPVYSLKAHTDGEYGRVSYNGTAILEVLRNDEAIESNDDKLLIIEQRNGIRYYHLTDDTEVSLTFDDTRLPNVICKAIYFNGRTMTTNYMMTDWVSIDKSTRQLSVDIEYDKDTYSPGDEVSYEIRVKDSQGLPVKASVNISVVDEAVFAVMEDHKDPLWELFNSQPANILGEFLLSEDMFMQGGAEGGEGGDDGYRTDFEDSAFFTNVETNPAGVAKGSFSLPDNITSWRVTLTAFTDDGQTEKIKSNVAAGLPFFAEVLFQDTYMAGDDIYIRVKSAGKPVYSSEAVALEVALAKDNGDRETLFEGPTTFGAGEFIGLGELEAGEYSLYVDLTAGDLSDKSMYTFQVKESLANYMVEESLAVQTDMVLIHNGGFVTLDIYNQEAYTYHDRLSRLANGSGSENILRSMAGNMAGEYGAELFGEQAFEYVYYTTDAGLLRPLENANGDVITTARAGAIGYLDLLRSYEIDELQMSLDQIIRDSDKHTQEYVGALWLKVMLDQGNLRALEASADQFWNLQDDETRLMLVRSLLDVGAINTGRGLMNDFTQEKGLSLSVDNLILGSDKTTREMNSAMLLGALTSLEEWSLAEGIAASEIDSIYERDSYVIAPELLNYFKKAPKPELSSQVTVSYGSEKVTETLGYGDIFHRVLSPEEAESFAVESMTGDLMAVRTYPGTAEDLKVVDSEDAVRTYRDLNGGDLEVGDLVEVNLTFTRSPDEGCFKIQDPLPAGLTFFKVAEQSGKQYLWGKAKGNLVDLWGCYYDLSQEVTVSELTFRYTAIATAPGTYGSEPLIVTSPWTGSQWVGEKDEMTIVE